MDRHLLCNQDEESECCIRFYTKLPGDDPKFHLYIDGGPLAANSSNTQSYNADMLTDALSEWRRLSELA